MKQNIVSTILLLLLFCLITGGVAAQEKQLQEKEKAPAVVPPGQKAEEPKSLGVAVAAPHALKPAGPLKVDAAGLGTAVQNRELVGEAVEFALNERVFLFLKLSGGPAEDITVTWKHGELKYDTKLNVGGSPWRTWAYKTAAVAGDWTVTVTDAAGTLLKQLEFTVTRKTQ